LKTALIMIFCTYEQNTHLVIWLFNKQPTNKPMATSCRPISPWFQGHIRVGLKAHGRAVCRQKPVFMGHVGLRLWHLSMWLTSAGYSSERPASGQCAGIDAA
jgi:hypothetical protein